MPWIGLELTSLDALDDVSQHWDSHASVVNGMAATGIVLPDHYRLFSQIRSS